MKQSSIQLPQRARVRWKWAIRRKRTIQIIMFHSLLFVQAIYVSVPDDDNQPTDKPNLYTACSLGLYGDSAYRKRFEQDCCMEHTGSPWNLNSRQETRVTGKRKMSCQITTAAVKNKLNHFTNITCAIIRLAQEGSTHNLSQTFQLTSR